MHELNETGGARKLTDFAARRFGERVIGAVWSVDIRLYRSSIILRTFSGLVSAPSLKKDFRLARASCKTHHRNRVSETH